MGIQPQIFGESELKVQPPQPRVELIATTRMVSMDKVRSAGNNRYSKAGPDDSGIPTPGRSTLPYNLYGYSIRSSSPWSDSRQATSK